ncbi:MAG: YbaY family lipoprotein, partial [Rhizobiaceae bacterium]
MLGRLGELLLFGLTPLLVSGLLMPTIGLAEEKKVSGEASYRERIALPPNAVLTVQLADVSLADAPAGIVAVQTISPAGQVPISFELSFDTAAIQPRM